MPSINEIADVCRAWQVDPEPIARALPAAAKIVEAQNGTSAALADRHVICWPGGWTAPKEWAQRLGQDTPAATTLKSAPEATSWPAVKPAWITEVIDQRRISPCPSRLLLSNGGDLNAAEEDVLKDLSPDVQSQYRDLVRLVARETGCAETRLALTKLLTTSPSPLLSAKTDFDTTLLYELWSLALCVHRRSCAASVDAPRLLREVILEVLDPRRMHQEDTPSCMMTSIIQFGMLFLGRSAEYVRQVSDLARQGFTYLKNGVVLDASESWLNATDTRTQSLCLLAAAYYARTYRQDPNSIVAKSLLYNSVSEKDLHEWFLGCRVDGSGSRASLTPGDAPCMVGVEYKGPNSNHALTLLSVTDSEVTCLNPWGRIERAPKAAFEQRLRAVMHARPDQPKNQPPSHLELSHKTGGPADWAELSREEKAAALFFTGFWANEVAAKLGLGEAQNDAINDFRRALWVVDQAARSESAQRVLAKHLAAGPSMVFREFRELRHRVCGRPDVLDTYRADKAKIDALRDPTPADADGVRRFVYCLVEHYVEAARPLFRCCLAGADTPIFDRIPLSMMDHDKVWSFVAELCSWLQREQLLGAAARFALPGLEEWSMDFNWRPEEYDADDFAHLDRILAKRAPALLTLIKELEQNKSAA